MSTRILRNGAALALLCSAPVLATDVFINEFHYDNTGTDEGEFIEVAARAGTDLTGWSIVLYNGSGGATYGAVALDGVASDAAAGFGFFVIDFPSNGIQNGSPDGIALVDDNGAVVQFLSYEGSFSAVDGPAAGLTSDDIGVSQSSDTPVGASLQLAGTGEFPTDFSWSAFDSATAGSVNTGQNFGGDGSGSGGDDAGENIGDDSESPVDARINEIHYDNDGTDTGEAIEVVAAAGTDVTGLSLVLYNGNGGAPYNTLALDDGTPVFTSDSINDFYTFYLPSNGLQNGSPDGVALVSGQGVQEFLSYEGTFTAVGGVADGLTSSDIGVSESGSTPVGFSLQRCEDAWLPAQADTFGAMNRCDGDTGGSDPLVVKIHEVQGDSDETPFAGSLVTVEGIVVGDFDDADELRGFYLQEEISDQDGSPSTSEGIFVFCGDDCSGVEVGQRVSVTGTAEEFFGQTQLSATGETAVIMVVDEGDNLSAITPADVTFPLPEGMSLERFEGMSVAVTNSDMRVIEYFNFDRFSELRVWTDGTGSDRPYQATQVSMPATVDPASTEADFSRQSVLLDDGSSQQNIGKLFPRDGVLQPVYGDDSFSPGMPAGGFRGGDIVSGIEGVLGFGFDNYRIHISDLSAATAVDGGDFDLVVLSENPRPATPDDVGGTLKVAAFNVLNFFTTIDGGSDVCGGNQNLECRGADDADELARQREKLVEALAALDADIIGLVEIENTPGVSAEGTLATALSTRSGRDYRAIETGPIGTDAIKVAILYNAGTIASQGEFAVLEEGFVDPLDTGTPRNRPALAQTFREAATGGLLTVVVNHLKSKGSGCGAGDDDPVQGNCNGTRTAAAEALAEWLAGDPTGSSSDNVLILGDLNAYAMEDPIQALDDAGYTDLAAELIGSSAYGYVFDGRWGTLDYALASPGLMPFVTGITEWHINADEPDTLDYDTTFNPAAWYAADVYRTSDHDPVIVGLAFDPPIEEPGISIADLRTLLAEALEAGDLRGAGRFGFFQRLNERKFDLRLAVAERQEERGAQRSACFTLRVAERRADGEGRPRDEVEGPLVSDLAAAIDEYLQQNCEQ